MVAVEARSRRRGGGRERHNSRRSERVEASEWFSDNAEKSSVGEVDDDRADAEKNLTLQPEQPAAAEETEPPPPVAASSTAGAAVPPPPPPTPPPLPPTVQQLEEAAQRAAAYSERREGVEHLSHLRELVGELAALLAEQPAPLGGGALTAEVYVRGSDDDDDNDDDDDEYLVGVGAEARRMDDVESLYEAYEADMDSVELSVELFDEQETADRAMRRAIRSAVIDEMPDACAGVIVMQRLRITAATAAPSSLHAAPCAFVCADLLRGGGDGDGDGGGGGAGARGHGGGSGGVSGELARQAADAFQRSGNSGSPGVRGIRVLAAGLPAAARDGVGAATGEAFGVAVVTRHGPSCFLLAQDSGHTPTAPMDESQQWALGVPERRRPLALRYAAFSPHVQAALELRQ